MIKTIKVKKQLRLDELIKYVWENSVTEKRVFLGNHGQRVVFDNVGGFYPSGYAYSPDTTFTVEVEEEITEDTIFEDITVVFKFNSRDETGHFYNSTLKDIKKAKNLLSAYIPIDGKLQLIWEAE